MAFDGVYRGVIPRGVRRQLRDSIANSSWISAATRRRLSHTFLGLDGESWASFYFDNFFSAFHQAEQADLLADEFQDDVAAGAAYRNVLGYWEKSPGDTLQRLLYTDIKTYLVELLMKQDNMSMASSIESRVPFLDHKLVEFASQVPVSLKLRGKTGKYMLKEAVKDLLPAEIIHRKKMGFPTPLKQWLLEPQAAPLYNALLERDGLLSEVIAREPLRALLDRHRNGSEDATDRIWNLLNLQIWGDIFLGGKRDRWREGIFSGAAAS
jgi:asparagine synthase (glutamine-hydrolysing)